MGLRQPGNGNSDPSSAIGSVYSDREGGTQLEGENGVNGLLPDLDKLSLEKGRPLDVEDLDDEGWHAASEQKKIDELGSLGEGAGGAVTRCKLKDGKTVFALKVSLYYGRYVWHMSMKANISTNRSSLQIPILMSRSRLFASSISTKTAHPTTSVVITVPSWTSQRAPFLSLWNSAKVEVLIVFTKKSRSLVVGREKRSLERLPKVC
jgi:hypothetical protein